MLYLGYVLLRYVLIYNLEVSYDFHLTVLQLNVIQMFPVQYKTVFYVTLGYFLRTPDNSNLFSISVEGSSYRKSTVIIKLNNYLSTPLIGLFRDNNKKK